MTFVCEFKCLILAALKIKLDESLDFFLDFIKSIKNSSTPMKYFIIKLPIKIKQFFHSYIKSISKSAKSESSMTT